VHVYDRQISEPRELSITQIPGGIPGGWLLQELTHALDVHKDLIWCEIYILAHTNLKFPAISKLVASVFLPSVNVPQMRTEIDPIAIQVRTRPSSHPN
jgi:hypothetical protein